MTKKECNSSFQNIEDSADRTWCTWIVVCRVKTGPAGQNSHTEVELSSGLLPLPSTSKIFRSRIRNRGQFVNGRLLIQVRVRGVDMPHCSPTWGAVTIRRPPWVSLCSNIFLSLFLPYLSSFMFYIGYFLVIYNSFYQRVNHKISIWRSRNTCHISHLIECLNMSDRYRNPFLADWTWTSPPFGGLF